MKKFVIGIFVLCLLGAAVQPVHAGDDSDIVLHAGASFVISTLSYNFYKQELEMSDRSARVAAFLTAVAVGALKEAMDDEFSGSDMAANAGGAALGVVVGFEF